MGCSALQVFGGAQVEPGACRSYGAKYTLCGTRPYRHGAPTELDDNAVRVADPLVKN